MMIHVEAYADETYLNDGYIVMGGYVASLDEWLSLATQWKPVLRESPCVPYFSNHGFKSQKWCLKNGVSLADMRLLPDKTSKLAHLIAASNICFPMYSRMWRSHFESAILGRVLALKNPRYELLRDPYYFCYVRLVSLLLRHVPRINECLPESERLSPIDVFVDENGKLAKKASELFLEIKRISDPERRALMGHAAPLDDKVTVPLQCADLYVGQLREYYVSGKVTHAMDILMSHDFTPPFSGVGLDWTLETLNEFADGLSGLPPEHWLR